MPRRKPRHVERPWQPDPEKWKKLLEKKDTPKQGTLQPKGGWQLWDWRTLQDVPQDIQDRGSKER
jgi:hypothetical protein